MKLQKICKYTGTITLITGLSIKGANNELNIGGADSEVVKNPITGEPYIPGSSLKGKMRSQFEKIKGTRGKDGREDSESPCQCGQKNCPVCLLFGVHGFNKNIKPQSAPTRIIVRDSVLTEKSEKKISGMSLEQGNYLELKAENTINRQNGTADSPRFMERVPAGLEFGLEILLQIFEGDNENEMKKNVRQCLDLVENSYLGGSGSRGYGQVKFSGDWEDVEVR